jgi:hypothetical protein
MHEMEFESAELHWQDDVSAGGATTGRTCGTLGGLDLPPRLFFSMETFFIASRGFKNCIGSKTGTRSTQ